MEQENENLPQPLTEETEQKKQEEPQEQMVNDGGSNESKDAHVQETTETATGGQEEANTKEQKKEGTSILGALLGILGIGAVSAAFIAVIYFGLNICWNLLIDHPIISTVVIVSNIFALFFFRDKVIGSCLFSIIIAGIIGLIAWLNGNDIMDSFYNSYYSYTESINTFFIFYLKFLGIAILFYVFCCILEWVSKKIKKK